MIDLTVPRTIPSVVPDNEWKDIVYEWDRCCLRWYSVMILLFVFICYDDDVEFNNWHVLNVGQFKINR